MENLRPGVQDNTGHKAWRVVLDDTGRKFTLLSGRGGCTQHPLGQHNLPANPFGSGRKHQLQHASFVICVLLAGGAHVGIHTEQV
eukprot:1161276-Pelagomonas_calceolata.AAC.2